MRFNLWRTLTIALFATMLTACGLAQGGDSNGGAPIVVQPKTPAEIVAKFLDAWNSANYQGMYALLSPQSQGLYAFPVFQTTYENVAAEIGLQGVTYTLGETRLQGMTAAVTYDVTLNSPIVGAIEDNGRTMRLVQSGADWRIAWTTMDIFDGLASGATLRLQSRRQPRGAIYDRSGRALVEQGEVYEVYAQRIAMFDVERCYGVLANLLRREYPQIVALSNEYLADTIFYVGDIDRDDLNRRGGDLSELCGISPDNGLIRTREDRNYYGHGAAMQVTGYVGQITADDLARLEAEGYQSGDLVGMAGVERVYEAQLSGKAERILRITEPGGTIIRELAGASGTDPLPVTLTIDRDLQLVTAQAISDAYNYALPNWGSLSPGAAAVVLDVHSGAILALASYPTIDPGLFSPKTPFPFPGAYIADLLNDPRAPFKNRATQEQYPPGSTFKIVTTLAAANERLMRPDEIFYCAMTWDGTKFGDTLPIRYDWRYIEIDEFRHDTGEVTIATALTASCNPFFYEMGARLFNERDHNALVSYARRLGLGSKTGVEPLMPEAAGSIPTITSVEAAINSAIGQGGVQVTPIQMARLTAAIANGGTIYAPYLVERVGGINGAAEVFRAEPEIVSELNVSPEALEVVRNGMCGVTTNTSIGTAWFVFENTSYTVCGKTGTAQTGRREPNAWFVAYAPADNPQIAIAVLTENSREGSEVSAPMVRRILDYYFKVPPEQIASFPYWWTGEYIPLNVAEAGMALE